MLTLLQTSNSTVMNSLSLGEQGLNGFIGEIVIWISLAILSYIVYMLLFWGAESLFRKTNKEIGILTVNILRNPLLVISILIVIKIVINSQGSPFDLSFIQRSLTAIIILVCTFLVNKLFTEVIVYSVSKYAAQTEADWDDVLVPLVNNTLPVVIYLLGGFLFLQSLGIDLTGLWVAFGGVSFVLGFALKDILSNFFSGLVLLIDTPFQFGDVVALQDGSIAIIESVGIRLTTLYLIESNCNLFMPNASLESQKLVNFSRPNSNYCYTITVPLRADSDPNQAIKIIEEVVLSHPDVLGKIDNKLWAIKNFYRVTDQLVNNDDNLFSKQETGRLRLMAEQKVTIKLQEIEKAMKDLISKIKLMEMEGLDTGEVRAIQGYYIDIVKIAGLEIVSEKQRRQRLLSLKESESMGEDNLINLVRIYYQTWQKDPDLIYEDHQILEVEWERKISFLKFRMNKFLQQITTASHSGLETKLDDYAQELWTWIEERFRTYFLWQSPRIWMQDLKMSGGGDGTINMGVKFFVDNVKLEKCQRGYRIRSEVHGEIVRRLRLAYFYR